MYLFHSEHECRKCKLSTKTAMVSVLDRTKNRTKTQTFDTSHPQG